MAAGVLLALVLAAWAGRRGPDRRRRVFAAGLVVAALVYLVAGGLAARPADLVIELAGFLLFSVTAVLGLVAHAGWLAAGWILHAGWDGLRQVPGEPLLPAWYAWLCLGFDLTAAAVVLRDRRP